jgi:TolB protein
MRASTLRTLPRVAFIGMLVLVFGTVDSLFQSVPTGQIAFTSKAHGTLDDENTSPVALRNLVRPRRFELVAGAAHSRTDYPDDRLTPRISGGEEKIAFVSRRGGTSQIHIMNADGSEQHQLTANSGNAYTPAISPDGTLIAFVSDREGTNQIYLMNIDGSGERRITDSDHFAEEPTWTPDGARVYYRAGLDDGTVAIFATPRVGGAPKQITDNSLRYKEPSVSPDGSRIVFNSVGGGAAEIWVMDIDGTNRFPLPNAPDWAMTPEWSPGGTRIAYALLRPATFAAEVHVMNSDGSGDAAITEPNVTSEYPCWSPDGKQIAFQTDRDGNFEIYVMNADGSEPRRLTRNDAFDGRPSWGSVSR